MSWGIRIALILVILGGLIWLNWDRFSELVPESALPESDRVGEQSAVNSLYEDKEVEVEATSHSMDQQVDDELTRSAEPEFDLQPVPESLDGSDDKVRIVAEELSPTFKAWLVPEEQLRKWTLLVKQASEGKTIYQDRPFAFDIGGFKVEERDRRLYISPENFKRYDTAVDVLVTMPADKLIAYYRSWYPLLEQAFAELGLPGSFDEQVDTMIERILAVELPEQPIELKQPTSVTYKFMDPELEQATQIEKCLWRMGPENARKVQDFALRLKQALER